MGAALDGAVLKITTIPRCDEIAEIQVEGRLFAATTRELRSACEKSLSNHGRVFLDLTSLTFADAAGLSALRELIARGAVLIGCSGFVKELLAAP